jgi:Zn-dependent peptidase ImmA (M78 family)
MAIVRPRRSDARREFSLHPTVRMLLETDPATLCPRQAVRNLVAGAVREARALGWSGPPFDVELLASLRGLSVKRVDWLGDDQDACLVASTPPVIYLNISTPRVRSRYSVAHEIVHTLLPGYEDGSGSKHWKYRIDGQSPVEQLCQVGASEVLMPTDAMRDVVSGREESIELATDLRRIFDVSLEAATRNLVDLSVRPAAMIVLQLMNKPSESAPSSQIVIPGLDAAPAPKRLRIHYAWTSRAWDGCFLPQYKSIPDDSIAYSLLEGRSQVIRADEDWTSVGGLGRLHVNAVPMRHEPTGGRILCLVTGA